MSHALIFNGVTLSPITHQNSLWIRSAELARALGYSQENSVSRIYRSNADEFTPEMTQLIEIPAESRNGSLGNLSEGRCRIFSLRGCHLVAMFSRTKVAKDFRRWVLDVLEKYAAEQQPASSRPLADDMVLPVSDRTSRRTDPERKQLTAIINAWVSMAPIHYASARAQVNAHFGVASVDALTVAQVKEAIAWVQAKIDALPPAPERMALPADTTDQIQKIAILMNEVRQRGSDFMAAIFALQSALRFRPARMNPAIPVLSAALERTLPQFGTAIAMNVAALSELLEVYAADK